MKAFIVIVLAMGLSAANAAEPVKAPTCGKTVDECQKIVDDLTAKLTDETSAFTGARAQRDNLQQSILDKDVQAFVSQQRAKK